MSRSPTRLAGRYMAIDTPLGSMAGTAAVLALLLGMAAYAMLGHTALPLAVFAATAMIAGYGLAKDYPHSRLGLCNVVTLSRAAMVALIAGALLTPQVAVWEVFTVATLAFALDGIDGWLARREGLASQFGARFDMEVDAALGAVLSLLIWTSGTTGPEILVLGFMRYAFVAASFLWPALRAPLPEAFRRKAICVVQMATLILLAFPLTPPVLVTPVAVLAAILLAWSFLTDIVWLARRAA